MAGVEIKRGEFLYRDTLFVDLGDNKRHPRASTLDLKELLLPKRAITTPKDQVAHFYEAQLIHYGSPRTKDKNTAKVRLTSTITAKTLAVPGHITVMEADTRKEYARKVKANAKSTPAADMAASGSKKRKANDSGNGPTTTISVKVSDTTLEVSQQTTKASPAKKKVGPISTPKKATSKPRMGIYPSSRTRVTVRVAPGSSRPSAASRKEAPRTKQTAKRSQPSNHGSAARNTSTVPQQVRNETPASFYEPDSNVDMEDAPPAHDST